MDFVVIDTNSQEWQYIWDWLSNHPINEGLEEPKEADNQGAKWEYIGSYMLGTSIIHEFLHQMHPKTQGLMKVSVEGSKDFTSEYIAEKYRL